MSGIFICKLGFAHIRPYLCLLFILDLPSSPCRPVLKYLACSKKANFIETDILFQMLLNWTKSTYFIIIYDIKSKIISLCFQMSFDSAS